MLDTLIAAIRNMLSSAERSGSRLQLGSGDQPDRWAEYKEVPLPALEQLEQAVALVEEALINEQAFTISDWQYEVANGDTKLGYTNWLMHKLEV